MSTTLVPPTHYVVKADGQAPQTFSTIAAAADAVALLGNRPARVAVVTGARVRRLNPFEQRELGRRLEARRQPVLAGRS